VLIQSTFNFPQGFAKTTGRLERQSDGVHPKVSIAFEQSKLEFEGLGAGLTKTEDDTGSTRISL
jgi:hypothetical protein